MFDIVDKIMASVFALFFIMILAFFVMFGGFVVYTATGGQCRDMGRRLGIEVQHEFLTGCMYNVGGQWVPSDQVTVAERNGKIVFVPKNTHRLNVQMEK